MKQLTFLEPRKLEWRQVPDPAITAPVQALVRPIAVALCDLDPAMILGRAPVTGPFALGHEAVADVVEVGEAVTSVKPGDRVVVPFQISCGSCANCSRGLTGSCLTAGPRSAFGLGPLGGLGWGGMLSDLALVPYADAMLLPLPPGIAPEAVASAADNVPDGWRTVAPHLSSRPGAPVLIVGGGAPSISLYAAASALALGAGRVDFIDTDPGRLDIAARLGAQVLDGPPPEKAGKYPITVDASNHPDGLRCALRSTEAGGVCTSVGIYWQPVELPLFEMYSVGVTFHTSRADARAHMPDVLQAVAAGRLDLAPITTAVVAWQDADEAILEPRTKTVVSRAA